MEVSRTYTAAEQEMAPNCEVCGRKLGVGFYFRCHICSKTYCYAHAPAKCNHAKQRQPTPRTPLVR